jgi:hypothetical protein
MASVGTDRLTAAGLGAERTSRGSHRGAAEAVWNARGGIITIASEEALQLLPFSLVGPTILIRLRVLAMA